VPKELRGCPEGLLGLGWGVWRIKWGAFWHPNHSMEEVVPD